MAENKARDEGKPQGKPQGPQTCYNVDWDCACIANDIYSDNLPAKWRVHRRFNARSPCCCWMCVSSEPLFVRSERTDAEMYVFTLYDNYLVVAFRGTESAKDLTYDLDVRQVSPLAYDDQLAHWKIDEEKGLDIAVQQGFIFQYLSLLPSLRKAIKTVLKANPRVTHVLTTGHSLGGALAYLFAALDSQWVLESHGLKTTTAVTFGAPRVGNSAFACLLAERVAEHRRYVNGHDPVPSVPSAPRFWHFGWPTYLKAPWVACNFLLFNIWFVEDHRMKCYLEAMQTSGSTSGS